MEIGERQGRWAGLVRFSRPLLLPTLSIYGLLVFAVVFVAGGSPGFDTYAYWITGHAPLYGIPPGFGGFNYPPPSLFFLWPLSLVPWPAVVAVWFLVQFGALAWICRSWTLAALCFLPVSMELYEGNVHLVMAAAIVLGMRWPAAWAFVAVTKITPAVGLVWFLVRREWAALAAAIGATAILVLVSLLIPGAWAAWWTHTISSPQPPTPNQVNVPLAIRLPIAALVVAWGAKTNRQWTVPVGATLALPSLWLFGLSALVAVVPPLRPGAGRAEEARGMT